MRYRNSRAAAFFTAVLTLMCIMGISAAAASAKLNVTELEMVVGENAVLSVSGTSSAVKWASADKSVCTVKDGSVTAVGKGKTTVLAKAGGTTLRCRVTVYDSYISVPENMTVAEGETASVSFMVRGIKKYRIEAGSSGTAVMTSVERSGDQVTVEIEGVSGGKAVFRVYDANNKSMSRKFTVTVTKTAGEADASETESRPAAQEDDTIITADRPAASDDDETVITADRPAKNNDNYADRVLELVNEEREKAGKAPLELDSELCKAADIRAKEISKNFSHTRPGGGNIIGLLDDMNIDFTKMAGENIARGQKDADSAMYSWMHSERHRKNILKDGYTRLGVGYDPSSDCWVQVFAD